MLTTAEAFGWDRGSDTGRPLPDAEGASADVGELADVALDAATRAARILLEAAPARGSVVTGVDTKISPTDMVSDVDRASERLVSRIIRERRPGDGVLGEEGTSRAGSTGVRWVVDPLDGTTNYLFGIPHYSVSIAAEIDGQPVVGVVLDPSREEIWAAAAGHGSYLNGRQLRVPTDRSTLETALVATGFAYRSERREWQAQVASRVIPAVRDIRRLGSAALDLCWTAGGRFDAYYEWGLNPWDFSAGALVASEAGAVVEVVGHHLVLAAPPGLFPPLLDLLGSAGGLAATDGPEPRRA